MENQSEVPRKILHIITKGSPLGGAQTYVVQLASGLPIDQFDSVVVSGRGEDIRRALPPHIRAITLPSLGRDISIFDDIQAGITLIRLIRKERPHIVHLNSSKIGFIGGLAVWWIRVCNLFTPSHRRQHIRIIFTAHGWASNENRPRLAKHIFIFAQWLIVLMADTTIAVSEKTRQDILHLPWTSSRVVTIYNGISAFPLLTRDEARTEVSNTYSIPLDTLWIGTLSELHPNKGLDLAIQALSTLPLADIKNISFIICGEGDQRSTLLTQIETCGLTDHVFLLGSIPNAKKYLAAFDIFSLTSRTESFPYALLEAGLVGLPCLSTYVGGIPEIIRNGVSGVLVEPHVADIARGFTTMISNARHTSYGPELQKKIQNQFSIETMLRKTISVYTS